MVIEKELSMKLREPIFEAQINKLAEALENTASVHVS